MIKKLYLPIVALLIVALSSCGKKGELTADCFTTNPEVLEAVAGKVPVTINGRFPEKFLKKNASVKVIPVLKWNGGEVEGQPAVFQGEKVQGNAQTISYKVGGNYTMKAVFDYQPEMAKSELYLRFKIMKGLDEAKGKMLPEIKIADGVISTAELATVKSANPSYAEDAFQRIIKQAEEANIMFLIQQAGLRSSQINSEDMKNLEAKIKEVDADKKNFKLNNVEVSAYASPDGGVELNDKLAKRREGNAEKFINRKLKRAKVETAVDAKYTAQDWEGFKKLVEESNLQDKDLILRVLSMYEDPEQREVEIKNISAVYKQLADNILPQLRRARLTANYEIIGRSDAEINEAVDTDAKVLSVEEILYAATLTDDNARKAMIFNEAVKNFPNDYRAYNNLGEMAYAEGDFAKAENFFKQAAAKDAAAAEVNANLGLIELLKGNVDAAETYLGKADGADKLGEALGILFIKQGQYPRACNAFGEAKTNAAAQAQILAKDYNKAMRTLDAVKNADAMTYYLKAVVGARTNNADIVKSNLKKAVSMDSEMKAMAENDIEFVKF